MRCTLSIFAGPRLRTRRDGCHSLSLVILLRSDSAAMANTIDQEALDASAGPSTPRPTVRASPEPPSSPVPSLSPPVEIVTPAPLPRPEDPPNAPTQLPPAKSIPDHTPSSSVTPTAQPHPDVSEFDPYATPVPRAPGQPSSASAPVRQAETAAKDNGASEPVFNFSGFLKDLRLKSSEPVARFLKRLVRLDDYQLITASSPTLPESHLL